MNNPNKTWRGNLKYYLRNIYCVMIFNEETQWRSQQISIKMSTDTNKIKL